MIGCARGGVRAVHTGAGVEGVDSNVPVAVANLTNVVAIDMFNGHVCALVASGSVRCWGHNLYGQLGNGTSGNTSNPATCP